jgi:tetratricopeptide (TPR) repeat protein
LGYGYGGYWPWYGYGGFGSGLGWGLGLGLGWGLWSWPYGSSLYDWGYLGYSDPYFAYVPNTLVGPLVYDYSQPINTMAQPPEPTVADQASANFDAARDAFKTGEYARALDLVDQAIRLTPNETALHEFRALALFALQRYDEAAAALDAVLAVGPGWNWPTLIGFYPSVDVYTQQLRTLEDYAARNPGSAAARLVLGYQYLTAGHTDAALTQFKRVVALQPKDTLTARLVQRLDTTSPPAGNAAEAQRQAQPPQPSVLPAPAGPVKEGRLEGTWSSKPDNDSTITLTFPRPGQFNWTVTNQGKDRQLQGKMTYGNGMLTLAQDQGPPMVGNITWLDETRFVFKLPGTGPDDPGLTFTKQP